MKVSVVGSGQVGATAALWIVSKELADTVVMLDVIEGVPQGKGLDILESTPVLGVDTKVVGSNDFKYLAGSDITLITAGFPRRPGMNRMELLKSNLGIVKSVTENIVRYAPNSKIIVVTNPLDIMTYVAYKTSKFQPNRVYGMAGVLDTSRFRTFVAMALGVSVEDVSAMVLGGHGDEMVPLPRYTAVSGIPIQGLLTQKQIDGIIERTRKGGGEIVTLLKSGSAFYAPGAAVTQMVEAIVRDKKRLLPVCAYLNGEYGFRDVCAGVPVILGKEGVEKIIELELTKDEKAQFQRSVDRLIKTIQEMKAEGLIS